MSAPVVAQMESKSAKKRKAKGEAATTGTSAAISTPAGTVTPDVVAADQTSVNGTDSHSDNAYVKELQRNVRNIHKKLAASAKADSVISENPGVPLDDLVASKKLNADQKAQVLKKPGLQSQLAQLEEQLAQYRSFAQELEERHNQNKAKIAEAHEAEITRIKEEAATHSEGVMSKKVEDGLRVISHFLHAAASKRQSDDATSEEGRAFEGALLLVYQGNDASLETLRNLITGADEKVPDVNGQPLDFTYAQIKQAATLDAPEVSHAPATETADSVESTEQSANVDTTETSIATDPTIANAGLTELSDVAAIQSQTGDATTDPEAITAPEQASTGGEAANAAAETAWDPQASVTTDASVNAEEWVQVPRDPAETETGITATPAAVHGSSSWAEEVGAAAMEDKAKPENDGFEQVRRDRDRGGRGGRGRGQRGEFRGRGRGPRGDGYRGGRGGPPRGRGGPPRGDRPSGAPPPAPATAT